MEVTSEGSKRELLIRIPISMDEGAVMTYSKSKTGELVPSKTATIVQHLKKEGAKWKNLYA